MQQGQERRRQNNEVGETRLSSPQKKFWESAFFWISILHWDTLRSSSQPLARLCVPNFNKTMIWFRISKLCGLHWAIKAIYITAPFVLHVPTPIQSWYIILGLLFSEQERQSPWEMEPSKHLNCRNGGILAGRCQSAVPRQSMARCIEPEINFPHYLSLTPFWVQILLNSKQSNNHNIRASILWTQIPWQNATTFLRDRSFFTR